LLGEERLDILAQASPVALEGRHPVGALSGDLLGDGAPAAPRVDCHRRPLDGQHIQEPRDGDDLVRLVRRFDSAQHQVLVRAPGREPVDGRLRPTFPIGAPEPLAVNGDAVGAGPAQRRHPGDEAALERPRVADSEEGAAPVMRGRPVLEGPEPTQESRLLLTELGGLPPALAAGEHAEKAQPQPLSERVEHLGTLAWVFQIGEMLQEINPPIERLERRRQSLCPLSRAFPRIKRITTDSALLFSTPPTCHAQTHAIALTAFSGQSHFNFAPVVWRGSHHSSRRA